MESCLLYCLITYIEENQLLLLLTSILIVVALWKSPPCQKKANNFVRVLAGTTGDGNTFSFAGENREDKGFGGLEIQSGEDPSILTPTEKAIELSTPRSSQEHLGSSESLHFSPVQISPGLGPPPVDSVELFGDHKTEDTYIGRKLTLSLVDQVEALSPEWLDNEVHRGLRIQSEEDTFILSPTEEPVVLCSPCQAQPGSSELLHFSPPVWISPESGPPAAGLVKPLGGHKTKEDLCTGHKPNLPTEDKMGPLSHKKCPSKMASHQPVSPSSREQPQSLPSNATVGSMNVSLPKLRQRKPAQANTVHQMQNGKSSEQSTLHMGHLDVTDMNRFQKVTRDSTTLTKPQAPGLGIRQEARSIKPRSLTKVTMGRLAVELHKKLGSFGKNPKLNATSSRPNRYDAVKTVANNESRTTFTDQLWDFLKSL